MTTMKKTRWFWAWDDEKEENWLRQMAQDGWHLISPNPFGSYTFESGEPNDVIYRLDYISGSTDKAEYFQLFRDAGWEHIDEMGGWQYFRKEYVDGEIYEIFSDNESKAKKYERVLLFLVILMPVYMMLLYLPDWTESDGLGVVSFIFIGIFLFNIISVLKLIQRISKLKKKL